MFIRRRRNGRKKMNHKQKVKLAKRMGGFLSNAWQKRKDAIALGVENRNKKIKKAIEAKKNY